MSQSIDFTTAPVQVVTAHLAWQLDQIRLSRNISQAALARSAGVSRRTLVRLADGQSVSLESFVRVMLALDLGDSLARLLPNTEIRPLDNLVRERPRQRASSQADSVAEPWRWGDEDSP